MEIFPALTAAMLTFTRHKNNFMFTGKHLVNEHHYSEDVPRAEQTRRTKKRQHIPKANQQPFDLSILHDIPWIWLITVIKDFQDVTTLKRLPLQISHSKRNTTYALRTKGRPEWKPRQ